METNKYLLRSVYFVLCVNVKGVLLLQNRLTKANCTRQSVCNNCEAHINIFFIGLGLNMKVVMGLVVGKSFESPKMCLNKISLATTYI